MPPARRKPNGTERCVYREGRQRCTKNGTGSPALCRPHRLLLEQVSAPPRARPASNLGAVLGDFIRGKRVDPERAAAAAAEAAVLGAQLFGAFNAARAGQPPPPRPPGWPFTGTGIPRTPPPPPPPDRERRARLLRARAVLGFPPDEALSEDRIKERKRQLARQNHPDRGGSTERMMAINAAADDLLAALETE